MTVVAARTAVFSNQRELRLAIVVEGSLAPGRGAMAISAI
jgi:hypothetical protein